MRDTWNDTNHYKNSNMHGKGIDTELSHNTTALTPRMASNLQRSAQKPGGIRVTKKLPSNWKESHGPKYAK